MWYLSLTPASSSSSFKISYCTILTLLHIMWDDEIPNLFLNVYNHSLLAVSGLIPLISGNPFLKSSFRLNTCTTCAISWNMFSVHVSAHKVSAFPILSKHLACTMAITFIVWDGTAKLAQISFFFFFTVLPIDLFLL